MQSQAAAAALAALVELTGDETGRRAAVLALTCVRGAVPLLASFAKVRLGMLLSGHWIVVKCLDPAVAVRPINVTGSPCNGVPVFSPARHVFVEWCANKPVIGRTKTVPLSVNGTLTWFQAAIETQPIVFAQRMRWHPFAHPLVVG